ncbi:MAG: TetR/AcrR family transcriptional regulator [Myxococcota bacterium]
MELAKRDGILSAAAKAFQRFGFKKASIDAIADAAGVAKGTIYLAAQSKEDLFYQVLHREVRSWAASVSKNLDPRQPADELLAYASEAGVRYLDDHPLVRSLLFGECHILLPKWKDRLDDLTSIGRENVVEILKLGQRQGIFREELDVEQVAIMLIDLQTAYLILHDHDRGPSRPDRLAKRRAVGMDLVLNGLRKPKPHHPA